MDPEHALELARLRVARVIPEAPPDLWRIETDSKVGVLVGEGWELRIRPRLAIPKLLFLLAYSIRPDGWMDLVAGFEKEDELLDAVAAGFSWHVERALEQGVLRGYVAVEERRHDLRGRVRFGDQIARVPGLPLPLEVAYDDFTADINENRFVLTAAEVLLRFPRIPVQARKRLLRVRALLEDVTILAESRGVLAPEVTRLNARYAPALALADLILSSRSIGPEYGGVQATTFLFDMNEVFESFVFAALQQSFRRYGGYLERQAVDYLDVDGKALRVEPDVTWWRGGKCRAVVDSKYKSLVDRKTMPNADAYQMLAYCITLGIGKGFLIYAKDEGERTRQHVIKRHPYEIDVRALDVEADPAVLLAQVDEIADLIASAPSLAAA
jgi:5-methylcytosine-specific restriction enzyme subunit McrC